MSTLQTFPSGRAHGGDGQLRRTGMYVGNPRPAAGGAVRYLHGIFAGLSEERLHAVFLGADMRYLHDRTVVTGGLGEVTVRARWLLQEAFASGAHGIVLAHNHLSGICRPSEADIETTRRLVTLFRDVEIELVDHFIFTTERGFSMRAGGYL